MVSKGWKGCNLPALSEIFIHVPKLLIQILIHGIEIPISRSWTKRPISLLHIYVHLQPCLLTCTKLFITDLLAFWVKSGDITLPLPNRPKTILRKNTETYGVHIILYCTSMFIPLSPNVCYTIICVQQLIFGRLLHRLSHSLCHVSDKTLTNFNSNSKFKSSVLSFQLIKVSLILLLYSPTSQLISFSF